MAFIKDAVKLLAFIVKMLFSILHALTVVIAGIIDNRKYYTYGKKDNARYENKIVFSLLCLAKFPCAVIRIDLVL